MFNRLSRALQSMASMAAIAALGINQLNEIKGNIRAQVRALLLQRGVGNGNKFARHSYTKRGPGRRPRWGDSRQPATGGGMSDEQRFYKGYMNRGEALRFIAAQPALADRQRLYNHRYPVRDVVAA